MFSTTAQTIIDRAEILLNDTGNARWSEDTLLSFLNIGQRDIATRVYGLNLKPAYKYTENVFLNAGSEQNLNDLTLTYSPIAILDVDRNMGVSWVSVTDYVVDDIVVDPSDMNVYKCITAHTSAGTYPKDDSTNWIITSEDWGSNIECIHQANLDTLLPSWQNSNTANTDNNGTEVTYWMENQDDYLKFHVYEQQPDSDYKQCVRLTYAALPGEVALISNNITLEDKYQDALMYFIIAMAFSIDDEVDQNGNTNSMKWMQIYANSPIFA